MTYDVEYDMIWHDIWHDMTWRGMAWHDTTRYDTLPKKSLATLDADIVDSENAVQFKMGMHLNYTVHKLTFTSFDASNIAISFMKLGKYPHKCFQMHCLPGVHINWNKEQISVILGRRHNFPLRFEVGHFGIKW